MFRTGSFVITKKLPSIIDVVHACRFRLTYERLPKNNPIMSAAKIRNGYWMIHGQQLFSTNSNKSNNANRIKNVKIEPPIPSSSSFQFPTWLKWVLSSLFSLFVPILKLDYEKLQGIEGKAEFVVEEVEKVANVVEKVAMVAEKVSEEMAEKLHEDGKLKKAALMVEYVSKQAAHDAQLTKEFVHKVDEFKNDLNGLESFIEPLIYKVMNKESDERK